MVAPTRERAKSYAVRMAEYERQSAEREARLERLWRSRKLCLLGEGGAWHVPNADARASGASAVGDGERKPLPEQRNPQREMRWLLCARENRFRMRLLTAPNLHFDAHELAARERDYYAAPSLSPSSEPMSALAHQVSSLVLSDQQECPHCCFEWRCILHMPIMYEYDHPNLALFVELFAVGETYILVYTHIYIYSILYYIYIYIYI